MRIRAAPTRALVALVALVALAPTAGAAVTPAALPSRAAVQTPHAGPSPTSTSPVTASGPASGAARPGDETAFVPPDDGDIIPGLDPRLEGLELDPAVGPDASANLAVAQTRRDELLADQARVGAALAGLPARQARLGASAAAASAELAAAQARLDALSSAAYTDAGSGPGVLTMLDGSLLDQQVRITMANAAARTLTGAARDATRARARAGRAARRLAGEEVSLRAQSARLASELPGADAQVAQWSALAVSDLPSRLVSGTGIPVAALDAYLHASRVLAITHPECGIQWWLLAGVADGESGHGTAGGARADVHGTVYPPIVGVALDGTNHTQAVVDTDFGFLDDDPVWDHAVGPFQFTPATWKAWASDGNFDGVADPQNLYDSALAAARKLCADAGAAGLHTDDQITRALTPYAVEARLVAQKLARARQYESEGLGTVDPSVASVLAARGLVGGVASASSDGAGAPLSDGVDGAAVTNPTPDPLVALLATSELHPPREAITFPLRALALLTAGVANPGSVTGGGASGPIASPPGGSASGGDVAPAATSSPPNPTPVPPPGAPPSP